MNTHNHYQFIEVDKTKLNDFVTRSRSNGWKVYSIKPIENRENKYIVERFFPNDKQKQTYNRGTSV